MTKEIRSSDDEPEDFVPRKRARTADAKKAATKVASEGRKRAGYIKSITMVNFMCHEQLALDFIPGMNFITGKNGSGKSTILTALSTCLGGKASATDRASSLKSLIKEGCQRGKVIVELSNKGEGAFDHKKYGDTISIERTINRETAATFKVKDGNNKTVETKASAVADIIAALGIQVDNPFAILTQDTARSFLASSSSEDKFRHLNRAMLLDKIEQSNELTKLNAQNIRERVSRQYEEYKVAKDKAEKLKKEYKRYEEAQVAYDRSQTYKAKLAWDKLHQKESEIQGYEHKVIRETTKQDELEQQRGHFEELHNEMNNQIAQVDQEINEEELKAEPIKQRHNDLEKEQRQLDSKISDLKANLREAEEKIKSHESAKADARKELNQINGRDLEQEKYDLREERQQLTDRKEQVDNELDGLHTKIGDAAERADDCKLARDDAKERAANCKNQIQRLGNQISDLKNKGRSKYAPYGAFMGRLVERVKNSRFKDKVLGPIGQFVELKDKNWTHILEQHLNGTLPSFVVFNTQDQEHLRKIMRECDANVQIIVRNRDLFNYQHRMPDTQYKTVLGALNVTNEDILRVLVDFDAVEKDILIEDGEQAMRVMRSNPKNVKRCISFFKGQGTSGTVISNGGADTSPLFGYRSEPRMGGQDGADYEKELLRQKKDYEQEQIKYNKEYSDAIKRHEQCTDERQALVRKQHSLKAEVQRLNQQIDDIDEKLSEEVDATKTQGIVQKIAECEVAISLAQEELAGFVNEQKTLKAEQDDVKEKIKKCQNEQSQLRGVIDQMREKQRQIEQDRDQRVRNHSQHDEQRRKSEHKIEQYNNTISQLRQEKESLEADARELGESEQVIGGLAEGEDGESLKESIRKIDAMLESLYQSNRNIQQVLEEMNAASEHERKLNQSITENIEFVKHLKRSIPKHEEHQKKVRNMTVKNMQRYFKENLAIRGFDGEAVIDRESQKVILKVATGGGAQQQDVNKLSGGEKSYSQVCLLAAIWKSMSSRLLALDEFDVFMDKVNRRISLKVVIQVLREMEETQSIFITPQELENSELDFDAADIKVVRMDDPERAAH